MTQILSGTLPVEMPQAGFYLWLHTPVADTEFTLRLYRDYNVLVLPGSYIGRKAQGFNPGQNHVRVALVAPLDECVAAGRRIAELAREL